MSLIERGGKMQGRDTGDYLLPADAGVEYRASRLEQRLQS